MFSPGEETLILNIKIGLSICADMENESLLGKLSKDGAEIVFECAAK